MKLTKKSQNPNDFGDKKRAAKTTSSGKFMERKPEQGKGLHYEQWNAVGLVYRDDKIISVILWKEA